MITDAVNPLSASDHKRDAYGFSVRPQHVQRYREHVKIYQEEEEERSDRWNSFLEDHGSSEEKYLSPGPDLTPGDEKKVLRSQIWTEVRPSLRAIEGLMSARVKKKDHSSNGERGAQRSNPVQDDSSDSTCVSSSMPAADAKSQVSAFPWKEELQVLVRGGAPMALRGELWQAFAGVKKRRVENYYQSLLAADGLGKDIELQDEKSSSADPLAAVEKWKGQIEKDLPRTFPGHPALDDDGRNALRRLLTAYARHNPSVGYCQAMNFFAGLLLLLMPEENAFWSLIGIIDDYFNHYYSEEMIESQVDQRVLEELVRERFPKMVQHLDYLGVQVACVTAPWFLSIFINMLPWESGNRVMLFRTALALMEFYVNTGPTLITTKDAGDAITLLQSMTGSTFDSSQLVFTACMGYQDVNECRLQELRSKHRPAVMAAFEERLKGLQAWRDSKDLLASKLYNSKQDPKSVLLNFSKASLSRSESGSSSNADDVLICLTGDGEIDYFQDLQGQVLRLKGELCNLVEEKRSALLRAEELEVALMEMVKQDNRRHLNAKIEQLEQGVRELRKLVSDKKDQEAAMIQVLMGMEQEHKVTEGARRAAEQDAAAQRHAAQVLQDKYEEAVAGLAEMEERAVMAESMLEATLQYHKAQPSPRFIFTLSIMRTSAGYTVTWPFRLRYKYCFTSEHQNY
ncbi:TBC1 domain family member 10B isoform X3 [Brassica napus]|uniref:TBC1 domain family member 10B isoform X3 n=1 Tax=Brassica napus TaxID=3708 RepID=UPI000BBE8A37|nr:TBC1 domain family member 10B isoform X3 [Brassica napus]